MSKLRIFYILSLVTLGMLLVFTVFKPMATGGQYSEVARESLLETEEEWIIQFDIINHEGKDTSYTVNVLVDGKQYGDRFIVQNGGKYTYIHHLRRDMVGTGAVSSTVYKEGEANPIEQATYYLK